MYEKPNLYKHWDFTLLDIIVLELCYFVAYYLRHGRMVPVVPSSSYTVVVLLIILLSLLAGMMFHNYQEILHRGYLKEFSAVLQHSTIVATGLILYLFIVKDSGDFSRLVLGYFYLISIPALYVERCFYKKFLHKKNTSGYSRRNAVIITCSDIAKGRIEQLKKDIYGIVQVTGIALTDQKITGTWNGYKSLGDISRLPDELRNCWVDEVFILLTDQEAQRVRGVLNEIASMGITLHVVLNIEDDSLQAAKVIEKMGDTLLLTESIRTITFRQAAVKRLFDIIGALIGLVITGILTVIVGPLIYMADPGPIFYKQKRIGRNGRVFNMYKFRSMYQNADARKAELMRKNEMSGLMFKMKEDPRILGSGEDGTKHGIGWFIRTTSIDEFPQFLNVLIGQLSLVGTRPPTVDEWKQYESHHRARMAVKPGITGLWQVSGRNRITDFEEVVKLDMEYINNFSLAEDLRIILRTIKVVAKREGAE